MTTSSTDREFPRLRALADRLEGEQLAAGEALAELAEVIERVVGDNDFSKTALWVLRECSARAKRAESLAIIAADEAALASFTAGKVARAFDERVPEEG